LSTDAWSIVRELAGGLPDVEEGTSYRTPALKVRGKTFARLKEDEETVAIWTDFEEREALVQGDPDAFFWTPHYEDHPMVLVRVAKADREELTELLTESWRLRGGSAT
jgi:hypothetical protein